MPGGGASTAPNAVASEDMSFSELEFGLAFDHLPAEQQAALQAEGIPYRDLSEPMKTLFNRLFQSAARTASFILDPDSSVRVNVTRVAGATHYTATVQATFLTNFLTYDNLTKKAETSAPEASEEAVPGASGEDSEDGTEGVQEGN